MKAFSATKLYSLGFGLFLGLCVWKFGNPAIFDQKIVAPVTPSEWFDDPWPLPWANWLMLLLAGVGAWLAGTPTKQKSSMPFWLWLLPLVWIGWQFASATQTVDGALTRATLWQFSGVIGCYYLGFRIFSHNDIWKLLLPGLLIFFAYCLVRSVDQHVFEYPQNARTLIEGERTGWTNFPAQTILQMKAENIILNTNGTDVVNPTILDKFKKGRVAGTLVYPNALAGLILLLYPISLSFLISGAKRMRPMIRSLAILTTLFLGGAAMYWSGSKLGWLIGLAVGIVFLIRMDLSREKKLLVTIFVVFIGLGVFALRFHHYFASGASSVGARFDYWRAAAQTASTHPIFGTGPGTFQRPYALIKSPEAEMARLTHNDYLEQFSDSGLIAGLAYAAWVLAALAASGRKAWRAADAHQFALWLGLLGWFLQGFGEFGLYIPALAWVAFTLLGCAVGFQRQSDARCGG